MGQKRFTLNTVLTRHPLLGRKLKNSFISRCFYLYFDFLYYDSRATTLLHQILNSTNSEAPNSARNVSRILLSRSQQIITELIKLGIYLITIYLIITTDVNDLINFQTPFFL